jgi:hypothetical protein
MDPGSRFAVAALERVDPGDRRSIVVHITKSECASTADTGDSPFGGFPIVRRAFVRLLRRGVSQSRQARVDGLRFWASHGMKSKSASWFTPPRARDAINNEKFGTHAGWRTSWMAKVLENRSRSKARPAEAAGGNFDLQRQGVVSIIVTHPLLGREPTDAQASVCPGVKGAGMLHDQRTHGAPLRARRPAEWPP